MDMAKEAHLGSAQLAHTQLAHEVDVTDNQAFSVVSVQAMNALQDILFGSVAGIVGKVIEYPFDTVKVRLQSQPDHLPLRYAGPLDCFKQSLQHEGFAGLYRGVSAPLVGAAVETSSLFFSYNLAQDFYRSTLYPNTDSLPLSALLVCGGVAGAFTSIFLTPIELVKCKMQVPIQSSTVVRPQGTFNIIASIYRHQGLAGFWRGQLGTLIRESGGCVAWFGSNEGMKRYFRKRRNIGEEGTLPVQELMAAGAVAGMSYNFLFFPADTIKSQMQTEDVRLAGGKRTFLSVGSALYRQQGLKGLYRGCGITVARSAPSSAVIFTVFEALKKQFS